MTAAEIIADARRRCFRDDPDLASDRIADCVCGMLAQMLAEERTK